MSLQLPQTEEDPLRVQNAPSVALQDDGVDVDNSEDDESLEDSGDVDDDGVDIFENFEDDESPEDSGDDSSEDLFYINALDLLSIELLLLPAIGTFTDFLGETSQSSSSDGALPRDILSSLIAFKLGEGSEFVGSKCAVCLEDMLDRCKVLKLTCNHVFHEGCLLPWFAIRSTCPVCRSKVEMQRSGDPGTSLQE
ncbi:hypothetical protein HAZT_HAZT010148 [Hyalella azteca]|uniref:E3 ubiquitin-protein ligase RDUF2 n=1 Tax=Hyalella azteca TaxID=294128 RepID=A0A6A0H1H8_HYAAZ|nr:E3 ubiquitin-protein ligase RDUF2 [Hyalella azteca]KAA0196074.1 hypothetical protein HAZT_HAZT010148 [Hyalella azteca]